MLYDIPPICLTLTIGHLHLDVGPGLPFGYLRVSRNLGYIGAWIVALSWDFRE